MHGRPPPVEPGLFAKLPSSIIGPEAEIAMPPDAVDLHFEGELVLVIGRRACRVPPERAGGHVFGVTCGNDVSERTWQRDDLQWLRAKGSDTFGPLGPAIVSGLDADDLRIETRLNGRVVQSESTADLIFATSELVSRASRYVTLERNGVVRDPRG